MYVLALSVKGGIEAEEIKSSLFCLPLSIDKAYAEQKEPHNERRAHCPEYYKGICQLHKLDTFIKPKLANKWKATPYQVIGEKL